METETPETIVPFFNQIIRNTVSSLEEKLDLSLQERDPFLWETIASRVRLSGENPAGPYPGLLKKIMVILDSVLNFKPCSRGNEVLAWILLVTLLEENGYPCRIPRRGWPQDFFQRISDGKLNVDKMEREIRKELLDGSVT